MNLKRRYLITGEQLETLKSKRSETSKPYSIPHPNAKAARDNREAIKSVNDSESLTNFDKILRYNDLLTKYLANVKGSVSIPKSAAVLGVPRVNPEIVVRQENLVPDPSPASPPRVSTEPISPPTTTPERDEFLTPRTTHTLEPFETPMSTVSQTPKTTKPKRRQRNNSPSSKYSKANIIATFDSKRQRKEAEKVLKRLDNNIKFRWDRNTGSPFYGSTPLKNTTIASLVQDHILKEPTLTTPETFRRFEEIVNE